MSFTLRPIRTEDEAMILSARNSDMVRLYMCSQNLITPQQHAQWFSARLASLAQEPYCLFLMRGKPIGVVGITQYNAKARSGEWGFYLFADTTPKGAGSAMLASFLEQVFEGDAIDKITSVVLADNARSLRLHEKLGFTQRGVLAGHVTIAARVHDVVVWSLTRDEWKRVRERFAQALETVTRERV